MSDAVGQRTALAVPAEVDESVWAPLVAATG
jgi:hypothetical protein